VVERRYNFDLSSEELRDDEWVVWWSQPNDNHTWAFIHWCRRHGNKVYVKGNQEYLNVGLKRPTR
jgi:hypothetical protein